MPYKLTIHLLSLVLCCIYQFSYVGTQPSKSVLYIVLHYNIDSLRNEDVAHGGGGRGGHAPRLDLPVVLVSEACADLHGNNTVHNKCLGSEALIHLWFSC